MNQNNITEIEYYMISNSIVIEALKKYNDDYQKLQVPALYIDFYFKEVFRYEILLDSKLKTFSSIYESKNDSYKKSIKVFSKSYPNIGQLIDYDAKPSLLLKPKKGLFVKINKEYLNTKIEYTNAPDSEIFGALTSLNKIISKIRNSREKNNMKSRYPNYEASKLNDISTLSQNTIIAKPSTQAVPNLTQKTSAPIDNYLPTNKKVSQIVLPRFALPTNYPISSTKSRIDSERFVLSFFSGPRLYEFLQKHKIVQIKYNDEFIEKRNALFNEKKSKFSDFF